MLKNIKYGKSLFQNAQISEEYQIPVIREHALKRNLVEYIDKSLIEVSVKENEGNLRLIETLSPQKRQSIASVDREEISASNFERMTSFDKGSMLSLQDMKRGSMLKVSNLLDNVSPFQKEKGSFSLGKPTFIQGSGTEALPSLIN